MLGAKPNIQRRVRKFSHRDAISTFPNGNTAPLQNQQRQKNENKRMKNLTLTCYSLKADNVILLDKVDFESNLEKRHSLYIGKWTNSPRIVNNYKYRYTDCWHTQLYKQTLLDIKGHINTYTFSERRNKTSVYTFTASV